MNELLAVDVGTGTIIGYLARKSDDKLEILAREVAEYPRRAVEEGRVVDMEVAADCLREVTGKLQDAAKTSVNVAHFAVPGRGLELEEYEAVLEFEGAREVTAEDVEELFKRRRKEAGPEAVVDISVTERLVDGEEVLNFEDQFGSKLSAKWLITSLNPEEVENKKQLIEKSGLIPGQLVLEPRAAVKAAFPDHEFEPRLGLVDFGAGTIDAAMLEDGKIKDFCTLLGSGDRLTRCLEEDLLVDFNDAEQIKRKLHREQEISFENLAGEDCVVSRTDMVRKLNPILRSELKPLKKWFEKREPRVLFLAGGGSRYPNLPRIVSKTLEIPRTDVVSRLPRLKPGIDDPDNLVQSPIDYTAYGILLLAAEQKGRHSLELTVNGEEVRRLVSPEEYRAGDLAEDLGYVSREPHPDSTIMVCVDGEWITERQDQRLRPQINVNGEQVGFDTILRSGDQVEILPAEEPEPAQVEAAQFLPESHLRVFRADQLHRISPRLVTEEGELIRPDELLEDGREYQRKLVFDRAEIEAELEQRGLDLPDRLLWKYDGQYTEKEEFEVGNKLRLKPAVNPSRKGLGNLDSLPSQPDKPLNQPLN